MSRLFYEDEYDALSAMVCASGKSMKECACFLYPDMKPESAYAKLKTQMNPRGDEELKFRQVIALMNFCQCYDPLYFACDDTLHARPDRKAPQDEEVRLVSAINSAAEVMTKAMKQLEHLQERNSRPMIKSIA